LLSGNRKRNELWERCRSNLHTRVKNRLEGQPTLSRSSDFPDSHPSPLSRSDGVVRTGPCSECPGKRQRRQEAFGWDDGLMPWIAQAVVGLLGCERLLNNAWSCG